MAQITITVPDPVAVRFQNAVCSALGYTGTHAGAAETKQAFVRRKVIEFLKDAAVRGETDAAAVAAASSAKADATAAIDLT